jgi:hypothetical protein
MTAAWQPLLPVALLGAVAAALAAVYGNAAVECLGPIAGGASGAVALRLRSGGRDHLLRVEVHKHPARNPHQYRCMEIAAAAGIAPALHYVEPGEGVAVMDFIPTVPVARFPGGPTALVAAQGALVRELQGAAPFPELWDFRTVVGRLLGLIESRFVPGLLEPHRVALAQLQEQLEWDGASHVSSHNDPNPRNVLFDGARLWLIDWETAYRNDPFVDPAIMADQPGITPELSRALLAAWLGRPANPDEERRLAQVTLLTRLYYAGLLFAVAGPSGEKLADLAAPSAAEFAAGLVPGAPPTPELLLTIARMRLRDFLDGWRALAAKG